jgi:hypothetical protein
MERNGCTDAAVADTFGGLGRSGAQSGPGHAILTG